MVASRTPTPSDRQGFDRRWFAGDLRRAYLPTSAAEVVEAWTDIHRSGVGGPDSTQITCGRHCYEDFVYRDATRSIIDVTGLRGYGEDPEYGLYIDPGHGNWDMYRILNNVYDRTLPAGSCYSVGLGGHVTGGGYGLLSRQFGLTVDHLTAVDLVVKTGQTPELVTASATENPDLFWALRGGGGGNFGIITRYYFGDPPRSPTTFFTNAANIEWGTGGGTLSERQFTDLLDLFSRLNEAAQGRPEASFDILHLNHQAAGTIVWAMYRFDLADDERSPVERSNAARDAFEQRLELIAEIVPMSDSPGPIIGHPYHGSAAAIMHADRTESFRQYTFLEGLQETNGSGPNRFGKYKSAYMNKGFSPTMASALREGLTTTPQGVEPEAMKNSLCQVDSYGCAINDVAADSTAIPQRNSIMKLQYQTYWDDDAALGRPQGNRAEPYLAWIRDLYSSVYAETGSFPDPRQDPTGTVDGCYFNYCDTDIGTVGGDDPGIDHAMYLYFKDNYATNDLNLKRVKRRWNPDDWFRSSQSIPL